MISHSTGRVANDISTFFSGVLMTRLFLPLLTNCHSYLRCNETRISTLVQSECAGNKTTQSPLYCLHGMIVLMA